MCLQPGGYNTKTKRQAHLSCSSSICPDDIQLPHQMLAKHSIKSVGLLPRKISILLRPMKDDLGLRTPRVYSLPCECCQVYIGQTVRSIETRIKEQHWHIQLGHPDKLAGTEHGFNHDHLIKFQDTWILSTVFSYMVWLIRELTELVFDLNIMNREVGLNLSEVWKPLICLLRESRRPSQ